MKAIPSGKEHLVRWRLGSIEVNQHERCYGFADNQALNSFPMSSARAASQRHTEHCHRRITAILDSTLACFHTDMDELIHAHLQKKVSQIVLSYGCCSQLILEQGKLLDCGRSTFARKYS